MERFYKPISDDYKSIKLECGMLITAGMLPLNSKI